MILALVASLANALQPTVVATGLSSPLVMAVDGDFLYFTTTGETLYRVPKSTSNLAVLPPPLSSDAVGVPGGLNDITFDANNMFIHVGGYVNGYISRAPKPLSSPANGTLLVYTPSGAMVGVIGSDMYFARDFASIAKINVLETNATNWQQVTPVGSNYFLRQKAVDATSIFFTSISAPQQILRFDVGTGVVTPLMPIPSEGNMFIDNANVYFTPGSTGGPGVFKVSKQGGTVTTLVAGANGAIGYAVGGGYVYYVENSTLWAIPSGGGTPVNLASPVDVHNMVYDNGTLYWGPVTGSEIYRLDVATIPSSAVTQVQSRPVQTIQNTPSTLPPPAQITKRNAVVLVHGWNSDPDAWSKQMGAQIRGIIDSRARQGFFANQVWDVIYVDWRGSAATKLPGTAKARTYDLGVQLANTLTIGKYNFIHFIAHSAGSNLVEVSAKRLRSLAPINAKPIIHETFLDAYAPNHNDELYGLSATFAEQYVTKEPLTPELIKDDVTNASLKHAFNFVVDSLNKPPLATNNCTGIFDPIDAIKCYHQWPYVWYGITVGDPNAWTYGMHIATEYSTGALLSQDKFPGGGECSLASPTQSCAPAVTNLRPEIQDVPTAYPWNPATGTTVTKSDSGTVSITSLHGLTLTTGSPVWVSLGSNVTEVFNTLQFDYRFASSAEGLLSVFLDDQVVFKADQRQAQAGVNPSGHVSVGNVAPGQHTLSFRLDHFTSAQSSVEISNIVPSNVSIIQVVNVKPVANAGQMQKVRLGTLVNLDGTRSIDEDRKPLPLTYDWKQTFGPPVLLFDSTSATPNFTPLTRGLYRFSLVVNDGQSNSNISTVKVHASKNGDLLIEEDNGTEGTSCVMCNPFSK